MPLEQVGLMIYRNSKGDFGKSFPLYAKMEAKEIKEIKECKEKGDRDISKVFAGAFKEYKEQLQAHERKMKKQKEEAQCDPT